MGPRVSERMAAVGQAVGPALREARSALPEAWVVPGEQAAATASREAGPAARPASRGESVAAGHLAWPAERVAAAGPASREEPVRQMVLDRMAAVGQAAGPALREALSALPEAWVVPGEQAAATASRETEPAARPALPAASVVQEEQAAATASREAGPAARPASRGESVAAGHLAWPADRVAAAGPASRGGPVGPRVSERMAAVGQAVGPALREARSALPEAWVVPGEQAAATVSREVGPAARPASRGEPVARAQAAGLALREETAGRAARPALWEASVVPGVAGREQRQEVAAPARLEPSAAWVVPMPAALARDVGAVRAARLAAGAAPDGLARVPSATRAAPELRELAAAVHPLSTELDPADQCRAASERPGLPRGVGAPGDQIFRPALAAVPKTPSRQIGAPPCCKATSAA